MNWAPSTCRQTQNACCRRPAFAFTGRSRPHPLARRTAFRSSTSREIEVLRLLVAGESNGRIAIRLGISVKTASVHVSNILRKLDAGNRVEAAVRASRMRMAELNGR